MHQTFRKGLFRVLTSACGSQVTRLIEGTEYEFRVAACNSAGIGPFSSPSDSAFAVDPLSEQNELRFNKISFAKMTGSN